MEIIYEHKGVQCCVVNQSDSEYKEFLKIRTDIWSKDGWEKVPFGEFEQDKFDSSSTYMIVKSENMVIGGCRLIMSTKVEDLPFAEYCDKELADGLSAEISRWCINPSLSKSIRVVAHKVMIVGTLKYLKEQRIDQTYMDVCSFLFNFMKKVNIRLNAIGKEHSRSDGSVFVPARLDIFASASHYGL